MNRPAIAAFVMFCAVGCGGLGVPDVKPVINGVSPSAVILSSGDTMQFSYMKDGVKVNSVIWSCNGGGISTSGKYTAPNAAGIYTITGIAGNQTSTASVTVG